MKRFAKLLLVTLGFGALGFVMSLVPQKNATGAGGAPVNIIGSVPLTVSGTVGVNNFPATQNVSITNPSVPVSGTVGITGNVPVANSLDAFGNVAPLASTDVDSATRRPFETAVCDATVAVNASVAQCEGAAVPLGTLLVVQYVTGACSVPVGSALISYIVRTFSVGGSGSILSFQVPALVGSDGKTNSYAISANVKQYADPETQVVLNFTTTDATGNTSCSLGVSGYLERAP
jgi:hypothetical protein